MIRVTLTTRDGAAKLEGSAEIMGASLLATAESLRTRVLANVKGVFRSEIADLNASQETTRRVT